jgi:uncharacterized membrane protein
MNKVTGAVVASIVAGMFAANAFAADKGAAAAKDTKAASTKAKCSGVNECKGKGECSGEGHSCAGHNDCKGKGWVTVDSAKACTDKSGTVVADAKKDAPKK